MPGGPGAGPSRDDIQFGSSFPDTLSAAQIAGVIRLAQFRKYVNKDFPWGDSSPATAPGAGGGRYSRMSVAVAIALAESGGRIRAVNRSRSGVAVGLWQIYSRGKTVNTALFDPIRNTEAALDKYAVQGFNAWDVYKSGAYKKFLPQAQAAVRATHEDSFLDKAGDAIAAPFKAGAAAFDVLTSGATWLRVGLVLGGAVVLILGIVFLYKQALAPQIAKALK